MTCVTRPTPSLGHRLVSEVLPRLRRPGNRAPLDADALRRAVAARHARETAAGPRPLPTAAALGFDRGFDLSTDDSAGFRTWIFSPRGREVTRTVVYLHGGSYMAGIDAFHITWTARLARALDARIVLPDYPLAPGHTWRDSRPQLVEMTRTWAKRAEDAGERELVLAGDSAGGGYALSVAQGVRDAGGPQPGRLVLHSPWVDLSTSTAEETARVARVDPWLDLDKVPVYAEWWAGSADDLARPEVSPVFGDLTDLPPALMFFGTRDLLLPGGRLLARRAAEQGWDLTSVEEQGLLHVYPLFPRFVSESRRAFAQVLAFLG